MSKDPFAVATVALAVIFRSRLNFTDVSRKLGELVKIDGSLTCTESSVRGRGDLRLAAAIQIAINRALAEPAMADRFRDEPDFAQMAVDAVYYIARRWAEEPDGTIDLSRPRLRDELVSRMSLRTPEPAAKPVEEPPPAAAGGAKPVEEPPPAAPGGDPAGPPTVQGGATQAAGADPPDPGNAAGPPTVQGGASQVVASDPADAGKAAEPADTAEPEPDVIGKTELKMLHELVLRVVESLANFRGLATALRAEAVGDWPLADIIPPGVAGLMKREPAHQYCYRFLLDGFGRPTGEKPPQDWTDEKLADEVANLRAGLQGIEKLLAATGLTIADFRDAQVLPESVSDDQLATLIPALEAVELTGIMTIERGVAIDSARTFVLAVGEFSKPLAEAVVLVRNLARDSNCDNRSALRAASRYFDTSRTIIMPPDRLDLAPLADQASSPAELASRFAGQEFLVGTARSSDALTHDGRWKAWRDHLLAFFAPKLVAEPISYDDMMLAALGETPGTLFRTMLTQMSVVDWSAVVLAGLPKNGGGPSVAPIWALVAALRALGFDRGLLMGITSDADLAETQADLEAAVRIAAEAATRPAGVIHVYEEGHPFPTTPPNLNSVKPLLALGPGEADAYKEALEWLHAIGGFEGKTYEKPAGQEDLRGASEGASGGGGEPSASP